MKKLLILLPLMVTMAACSTTDTKQPKGNDKATICAQLKNRLNFSATNAPVGRKNVKLQSDWYATTPEQRAELIQEYKQYGCDENLVSISP